MSKSSIQSKRSSGVKPPAAPRGIGPQARRGATGAEPSRRGPQIRISRQDRRVRSAEAGLAEQLEENKRLQSVVAALEQTKRQHENLFVRAKAAQVVLNASGRILAMNSAARKLLGPLRAEPLHSSFSIFLAKADIPPFLRHLRDCILTRAAATTRLSLQFGDGSLRELLAVTIPCGRASAKFDLFHCVLLDDRDARRLMGRKDGGIKRNGTPAKRQKLRREWQQLRLQLESRVAEQTARLQEAISELDSFSYTLLHDLRAPLRSMHGFSEILLQSYAAKLGYEGQDFLRRIMSNAQRLDMLILDVLNYARINRSQVPLRRVDLDSLVRGVLEAYPEFQPPRVEITVKAPLLPVIGHEGFLTQCISNLLSNAIKFVHPGAKPCVRIHTRAAGEDVKLCFQDNGIGIASADQQRIFQIFQRIHSFQDYAGTGVGLAIVRRAAERMGGQVGFESEIGKGSRFWLQLPRG